MLLVAQNERTQSHTQSSQSTAAGTLVQDQSAATIGEAVRPADQTQKQE
jgi:hypothetical protein